MIVGMRCHGNVRLHLFLREKFKDEKISDTDLT